MNKVCKQETNFLRLAGNLLAWISRFAQMRCWGNRKTRDVMDELKRCIWHGKEENSADSVGLLEPGDMLTNH